jgi:hypothetical protein
MTTSNLMIILGAPQNIHSDAWSSTIFQLIIYMFNCITYPLLTGMVLSNFIITAPTHFLFKIKHWAKKSQEDIFTSVKFCKMPIVTTENIKNTVSFHFKYNIPKQSPTTWYHNIKWFS